MDHLKSSNAGTPIFRRFFVKILWITAVMAVLLRIGVALEFSVINGGMNNMLAPPKVSDLHTYIKLGSDIARGIWPAEFYYQPFYYAVFLPVIYLCSGFSLWAVVFVQAVLGGATTFITGLIGRELFGRTAGVIAAVLTAISTPLLLYAPFHQNETLQCFNLTLLFYLLLKAMRRKRLIYWAAVGAAAGIAVLTRGNILLFVPLLLLALWIEKNISLKKKLLFTVVTLGIFMLVQLPFILHNTRARGKLTGPSTAADAVLALGNTPESPPGGRNAYLPAGPMEYPQSFHDFMENTGKGISVPQQMLQWMIREPGAFFELQFRKLLLFWDGRELPNNVSLYGEGEFSTLLKVLLPGRSHVILTFALAGMLFFVSGIRKRYLFRRTMLYGFVVIYWGAVAIFYILSRFRAPILPLTAVFAGAFLSIVFIRWKNWGRPQKYKAVLAAVVGCFLTVGAYDFYADNLEPVMMRLCRRNGTVLKNAVIDHGPFTCGAWCPVKLTAGTRIRKSFAIKVSGRIQWTVQSQHNGMMIFNVNGTEVIRKVERGMNKIEFPASQYTEIEIIAVPDNTAGIFDARRNYGRSGLDGEQLPGEWIMRCIW